MSYFNKEDTKFGWYFEFITKSLSNLTNKYLQTVLKSYKERYRKMTSTYDVNAKLLTKAIIIRSYNHRMFFRPDPCKNITCKEPMTRCVNDEHDPKAHHCRCPWNTIGERCEFPGKYSSSFCMHVAWCIFHFDLSLNVLRLI